MGTNSHIIPSPVSNFNTHSMFFCFHCFYFSIPRARSPFPVPRFSNIATQNCASTVKSRSENIWRRIICGKGPV